MSLSADFDPIPKVVDLSDDGLDRLERTIEAARPGPWFSFRSGINSGLSGQFGKCLPKKERDGRRVLNLIGPIPGRFHSLMVRRKVVFDEETPINPRDVDYYDFDAVTKMCCADLPRGHVHIPQFISDQDTAAICSARNNVIPLIHEVRHLRRLLSRCRAGVAQAAPTCNQEESEVIQLYKNGSSLAIATEAKDEREFLEEFSLMLSEAIDAGKYKGEWENNLSKWLPQAVDICCRMRGYKTESVREKRVLIAGDIDPRAEDLSMSVDEKGVNLATVAAN